MSLLIAIEGIDGSGHTTHARLLVDWLMNIGKPAVYTREPSDLPIGKLMREYLKNPCHPAVDALLFAADRADHYFSVIKPALDAGKIVVSDRHKLSSYVYQSSNGLDLKWIQRINSAIPDPDLNIVLDIEPELALKRKKDANILIEDKFENRTFLHTVRKTYLDLASRYANIKIISSQGSIVETHTLIQEVLQQYLAKHKAL